MCIIQPVVSKEIIIGLHITVRPACVVGDEGGWSIFPLEDTSEQ